MLYFLSTNKIFYILSKSPKLASLAFWNFELIGKIYYEELSGTMFHPMAYYRKLVVIKTRAIELRKYIDILELK